MDLSIATCESYESEAVEGALRHALDALGGLDWVRPGMRIAVKANLVSFLKPEAAATTHPAVLCALTKLLVERGAQVVIGDSPGGLFNAAFVGRVYAATGMHLAETCGAVLNQNFAIEEIDFPQAKAAKHFTATAWLGEADAIINVCKLKSHGMMSMSAAVKNMFGAIPGTMKPEYHYKYPNESDFADMLVDLNEYFKPRLCIADAIIGMEGNGPTRGKPRAIGALLASESPYALDLACAHIMGLGIDDVPTLAAAQRRNLMTESVDALSVAGDLEAHCVADFDNILSRHGLDFSGDGALRQLVGRAMMTALASRPRLKAEACIGCGLCARTCPAHAIDMAHDLPRIRRQRCIRCFCCQEFCPKGAMVVYRPVIARLLNPQGRAEHS